MFGSKKHARDWWIVKRQQSRPLNMVILDPNLEAMIYEEVKDIFP